MRDAGDEARSAVAASGAELGRVKVQHRVDIEGAQAAAPACLVRVAPVRDDLPEPQPVFTHSGDCGQHGFCAVVDAMQRVLAVLPSGRPSPLFAETNG